MFFPVSRKPGFTLIELLIVVAIIAILAAIAVPNFLEAQTRSKVSRTQADMRTMSLAAESYRVDWNLYPIPAAVMAGTLDIVYPMPSPIHALYAHNFLAGPISTPLGYITTVPVDVFADPREAPSPEHSYTYYQSWEYTRRLAIAAGNSFNAAQTAREQAFGAWVMFACGPDGDRKDLEPAKVGNTDLVNGAYDATNGTVSNGDIVRSQKKTVGFVH